MNKTAVRNFAVWARVQLLEAVKQRAFEYEIYENRESQPNLDCIGDKLLTKAEKQQRKQLIEEIRRKEYSQTMEEAAYTWFNRFIALRFMEVNNYLPSKVRVFTDETGAFKPEILKEAMTVEMDGLNPEKVLQLLDKQDNEELYKYLLITQCNALSAGLPKMFERIANWTELLFPENLLRSGSVLDRMISDIPEEDWLDAVQIIGWLYQYYNTELKDDTFDKLKKNIKITKERIPAATQLFTPDWIVRYMVENSLGRLWLEGHPNAELHDGWKYYLDEAEQEPEVEAQLAGLREEYKTIKPEGIKVIDPCMGSGHILVYAFDVLMQIYASAGWDEREAAQSILKNNLYGLDIDDRAAQLAYFAVMMKARQYDRRLLTRGIQPNVYAICESNGVSDMAVEYFYGNNPDLKDAVLKIVSEMKDAEEYGSILHITPVKFDELYARFSEIEQENRLFSDEISEKLLPVVQCAELLAKEYDVVVTNPPYMAVSNAGAKVNDYVKKNFPDSKADMFAVFIERCGQMAKKNGYQAMITQHAWMFLSSFEKLRAKLLAVDIVNMAHLGARAFEEIGGEVVQTTSFVIRKSHIADYKGEYCRLIEPTSQQGKEDMFLAGKNRYAADQSNFSKIPGSPVAYWVSDRVLKLFDGKKIGDIADAKSGMTTTDNTRFLRLWFEVGNNNIGFNYANITQTVDKKYRWFPFCKGGDFRRWAGNEYYVVNWYDNGAEIRKAAEGATGGRLVNVDCALQQCAVWTKISSSAISLRKKKKGIFFSDAAPGLFSEDNTLSVLLGLLNTKFAAEMIRLINPTLNFVPGAIANVPIHDNTLKNEKITDIVNECVGMSQNDWDSYETSWDFKRNPLV